MRRRAFLATTAIFPLFAWHRTAFAQTKQSPIVIGWVSLSSRETNAHALAGLKEGLAALGWKEGSQVVFEEVWADGRSDRLPSLVRELAAKKPAVIVATSLQSALSAAKGAPAIPIVIVIASDPVAAGLAASLARPGGMVTGVTGNSIDLAAKLLELLLAAAPKLRRVGFLVDPNNANRTGFVQAARRSAAQHSVDVYFREPKSLEEIEPAISQLMKEGAQALVVPAGQMFATDRRRIVKLALAQRWPLVAGQGEYAQEGALIAYGVNRSEQHRRAAYFVDRILKGAKPGDLPIEQPTTFQFVINLKTAKAIGLTIPQELLLRADKVIE